MNRINIWPIWYCVKVVCLFGGNCQTTWSKQTKHCMRQFLHVLKVMGQPRPLFVYFCSFQTKNLQKNCMPQRDSNLDRRSIRKARWPPSTMALAVSNLYTLSRITYFYVQGQIYLINQMQKTTKEKGQYLTRKSCPNNIRTFTKLKIQFPSRCTQMVEVIFFDVRCVETKIMSALELPSKDDHFNTYPTHNVQK